MTGLPPSFRPPPGVASVDSPIESRSELLAYFEAGAKPASARRLGVESERVPLRADGRAAPWKGDGPCVRDLLAWLAENRSWEAIEVDGHLLSLRSDSGSIYLEPGAQPEIALPPLESPAEVLRRLQAWREDLRAAAEATGVHAASLGLQPVTPISDIAWIPRERYGIMKRHLGARGALAHHMMKGTAGVQVNVDYTSEVDAAEVMRCGLSLAPLVNALVANSPLEEGAPNGFRTKRPAIWLETDPERCGLLSWVFEDGFSFERYLDWSLSSTVMFVVREDRWIEVGDVKLVDFLERGHPRLGRATHADFQLHLTTLFPEVRLKQHVEIRGADAAGAESAAAVTALWHGVLHDVPAREKALALLADLETSERETLHEDVGRHALSATLRGEPVRAWAKRLIDIAAAGLDRIAAATGEESDARLLEPLREAASSGESPAERLLADFEARGAEALLERV